MRATHHPDEVRQRYLGQIAPLLEAARPLDSLSPAEQRKVRRRIVRTLFGTRHLGWRGRLLPVLAGLGLLVVGGGAFATAQRLGILPRLSSAKEPAAAPQAAPEARKRKTVRGKVTAAPHAALPDTTAETAAVELPAVPDPLLSPSTSPVWVWAASAPAPATEGTSPAVPAQAAAKPVKPRAVQLALATPPRSQPSIATADPTHAPAPIYPAPAAVAFVPPGGLAPAPVAAPAWPVAAPATPAESPRGIGALGSPSVGAVAQPAPAVAPAPIPAAAPAKDVSSDQASFGQALRLLRGGGDARGALALLREHAKAYPKSAFASERAALEVEALLTLHRDREALALLDGMDLDDLPRSGERFVVRGELRAAVRRWQEASTDFDRALGRVSGSPGWHERALWGRGVARLRTGEREAGMADIEHYRDTYPKGRFAAEAAKFFPSP